MGSKDLIFSCLCLIFGLTLVLYLNKEPRPPFDPVCADIFFSGGTIWTGTDLTAEAVAVKGNKILAVGSYEEVSKTYCPQQTVAIPLKNKMLTPGWIDAHVHSILSGLDLLSVQISDCVTHEMLADRIEKFIKTMEPGEWLTGSGWNQERFQGDDAGVSPDRLLIDKVAPNNPVWLCRMDLHQCVANTMALEIAGVALDNPPDIPGGVFQLDEETGLVTGIVKDNAMSVVAKAIPKITNEKYKKGLQTAMDYFVSQGVTSINHVVNDIFTEVEDQWRTFEDLYHSTLPGKVNFDDTRSLRATPFVRTYFAPALALYHEALSLIESKTYLDTSFLRLGAVKGFLDGSLGSYTALMMEPYSDTQGTSEGNAGIFLMSEEEMYAYVKAADHHNLQVCVHAIGSKAVHTILNIFERVSKESPKEDRRFRIEHCQHIEEYDWGRLAELGIVASVQPYHMVDDGLFIERALGQHRFYTSYPFRSLLERGTILAFGSDWNVAPASPLLGMQAAVTRNYRDLEGNLHQFVPEECITIDQALHAYTTSAAYAEYTDDYKGKIAEGFLADLVVIDQDILKIDPADLDKVNVDLTLLDGQIVFESKNIVIIPPSTD